MSEKFIQALEEHHHFPEMVCIKVIGANRADFVTEVLNAIKAGLHVQFEPRYTIRETPHQRHLSISVEVIAGSAESLADAYQRISAVEGVVMVL